MSYNTVPIERLHQLFVYDEDAGVLLWLRSGEVAGSIVDGYVILRIDGRPFKGHRVCYAMYHGEWPDGFVDHWDGDGVNNRPGNMRPATRRQNQQNMTMHRRGKLIGTHFNKRAKKWEARIFLNGKSKHLGVYDTEIEAHEIYISNLP